MTLPLLLSPVTKGKSLQMYQSILKRAEENPEETGKILTPVVIAAIITSSTFTFGSISVVLAIVNNYEEIELDSTPPKIILKKKIQKLKLYPFFTLKKLKGSFVRLISALITLVLTGTSGYILIKRKMESNPDSPFTRKIIRIAQICKEVTPYITDDERFNKTLMEKATGREPKYTRLLKEAQEVLGVSEASDEFDAINKLRMKNRALKDKITELKKNRLLVPKNSTVPFVTTQESINKEISSLENTIYENNQKVEELKTKVLSIFIKNNLSLTAKELDYFLISAEGDDLLTLVNIANNMRRLQELIEKELASDPNNVQLAKSYTGMYLVSMDAYGHAHEAAIANIHKYRRKLDDIFLEAEKNYNEAIRLKAQGNSANATHIDSNLALNKKTLEIVQLYDSLLERRIENLLSSQANVRQKVSIAQNTYKTLDNGSMLINLVASASNEYSLLVNFDMPELKNIYDTGMLNAFMDISEKIKEGV